MRKCIPLDVGSKFGTWTIIQKVDCRYLCRCECGRERIAKRYYVLANRKCQNCISLAAKKVAPHYEKLHAVWVTMRQRCCDERSSSWSDYGGRGIRVCREWERDFELFRYWAIRHGYKDGMQIDRIDNSGHYKPENCRWVTRSINMNNTRHNVHVEAFGETKTIKQWSKDVRCAVKYQTLYMRLTRDKMNPERAITQPKMGT